MKMITINLSYYNQDKEIVLKHLKYWNSFDPKIKEFFTFFIIDDCSKIPINNIITKQDINDLDVVLYRVEDDLYCNIGGVRNLGAKECSTPWYVIIDMDTIIDPELGYNILKLALENMDNNFAFKFNRKVLNNSNHPKNNHLHPAVCLIRLCDYWNIGGCDEDLVGFYGFTDPHFWERSKGILKIIEKKNLYIEYDDRGEADINRDFSRNERLVHEKIRNNSWSYNFVRFKWHKINVEFLKD